MIKFFVPAMGLFLSIHALAAPATPVKPKIEELKFENDVAKVTLPLKSHFVLEKSWPSTLGSLESQLERAYFANCNELSYGGMVDSFEFPIRFSEIPELDQPMRSHAEPIVKDARCSKPRIAKNNSGFSQASGAVQLTLAKPMSSEQADRRLYKISLPWKKSTRWGMGTADAKLFKSSCEMQGDQASSAALVTCSEPEMSVACCGNASLTGEMNALVYAYAKHEMNSETVTGDSELAVAAKTSDYLAKKSKALGGQLAFSICTPANWEYAPIMAYQSTCYTLEQSYVPADATIQYCSGSARADTKVWVLLKHDTAQKRDYISVSVQSPRSNSSYGDYVTAVTKNNSKTVLKSDAGALFTLEGKSATLAEGNRLDKDLPPGAIALSCK